jgi:hypothetical protein
MRIHLYPHEVAAQVIEAFNRYEIKIDESKSRVMTPATSASIWKALPLGTLIWKLLSHIKER